MPGNRHLIQSAIANKAGISERRSSSDESIMPATRYLDTLNVQQRLAVEHGVRERDCAPRAPLLVIAGAGSGKTNTLAHRVAHLIVNGADPRRILMMTFSRRAASEMTRRVERIARKVMGDGACVMTDALSWAGTFHGIGARILRDYADQIGLDPAFTIHDREDSADLINLVRHELKDMLAMLRFVENPRDRVAGFRLMHLIPGVGSTSAQRVLDHMAKAADPTMALAEAPAPPRAGNDWQDFVDAVTDLRSGRAGWPAELERARLWYEPHLDRIHEDAGTRRADLVQLEQIAGGYPSRQRFLTELTLDPPDATSDQAGLPLLDEDYLILSTIHSAKGQEWKSVFVLNVVDGCMPSDLGAGTSAEIEEERRLLYVAMTRAKDELHLVVPQRFFTHGQSAQGDRHVYAARTRFIPDRLLGLFEKTSWPRSATGIAARAASQGVRLDIGARMRGMWR